MKYVDETSDAESDKGSSASDMMTSGMVNGVDGEVGNGWRSVVDEIWSLRMSESGIGKMRWREVGWLGRLLCSEACSSTVCSFDGTVHTEQLHYAGSMPLLKFT